MWLDCLDGSLAWTSRASASSPDGLDLVDITTGGWPNKAWSTMSLTSQGSPRLGHLMPNLVASPSHQGRLRLRLCQREPLEDNRGRPNQALMGADRGPPQIRVDSQPPLAKVERLLPPDRAESHPLPIRGVHMATTSKSGAPATPGGPSHLPSDGRGARDGGRPSWYEQMLRVAQEKTSGPSELPHLLGLVEVRRDAVHQIYA